MIPSSLLSQTVKLSQAYTLTVKDQHGAARSVDINPANAERWFRFMAAANGDATASTATTEEAAVELKHHIQTRLNNGVSAVWSLSWTTTGFIKITYTGTGLGQITWDTNNVIRNLLGFTGSATSNLGTNAYVTGSYQPAHILLCVGRETDQHWAFDDEHIAAVELRGGQVDSVISSSSPDRMRFTSDIHPTTAAYQSSLGIYSTPINTSGRNSRVVTLGAGALAPPWSAKDFFDQAVGSAIGAMIGTFQDGVAGTATVYDLCYLVKNRSTNLLKEPSFFGIQRIKDIYLVRRESDKSL